MCVWCVSCIGWSYLKIMHFLLKRAYVVVVLAVVVVIVVVFMCPVCVISLDIPLLLFLNL